MSAKQLQTSAAAALECVRVAQARRQAALEAAEKLFRSETTDAFGVLSALRQRWQARAYELACECGDAPVSRCGASLPFSCAQVSAEGIELVWYNNDGPDEYVTVSWEELAGRVPQT